VFAKEKETVTEQRLLEDLRHSAAKPATISQREYNRSTIPCLIGALLLVVLGYIYPKALAFAALGLLALLPILAIGGRLMIKIRVRRVKPSDYILREEALTHKDEEHFTTTSKYRSKIVNRYLLCFEGVQWEPAKENFAWRQEGYLSDYGIHQTSHRGDRFLLVIRKRNGKIAVAYPLSQFEFNLSGMEWQNT